MGRICKKKNLIVTVAYHRVAVIRFGGVFVDRGLLEINDISLGLHFGPVVC
jgi:hypothetical protein